MFKQVLAIVIHPNYNVNEKKIQMKAMSVIRQFPRVDRKT